MAVLEVKNLKKKLGKREIIKDVTFSVKEGEIFGFLGKNGAGKTTTIRMLVGLIKHDGGTIKIMGHNIKSDREKALKDVGAVVENPELYGYLTGRQNLIQIAKIRKVDKAQIDEIIKLINIGNRIDEKVSKYSLGMKQRLGLGAALLDNPKLLILDEPTNGLDPSGILDFREIVKKMAKERGMAVFVSSHILSEVQQLCDTVAFISDGAIKAVESIGDGNIKTDREVVELNVDKVKEAYKLLQNLNFVFDIKEDDEKLILNIESTKSPEVVKALVKEDIDVIEIFKKHSGLEQRYMELVEGGAR